MSSSVTIDWVAVRERERQAQVRARAELARLAERARQLQLRNAAVSAVRGRTVADVPAVRIPLEEMDSAGLAALTQRISQQLNVAESAIEQALTAVREAHEHTDAGSATWSGTVTQTGWAGQPVQNHAVTAATRQASRRAPATPVAGRDSALAAADAAIEECTLRCPDDDLSELTLLRDRMRADPGEAGATARQVRYVAAQIIQRAKRREAVEQERQRLLGLVDGVSPDVRETLRRRVRAASERELSAVEREIAEELAATERERSREQAWEALRSSFEELGYEVGESFQTLVAPAAAAAPGRRGAQDGSDPVVVVASPHSPDHGVRVRLGPDGAIISVVRREDSADGPQSLAEDTEVQTRTCADVASAVERASDDHVRLRVGAVEPAGRQARRVAGAGWAAVRQTDDAARRQEGPRRAAEAQRRQAALRARGGRSG